MKWPQLPERKPKHKPQHAARADSNQYAYPWQTWGMQIAGTSYQAVDPVPGENSLQSVAFHSSCDLLASIVSELPLVTYRDDSHGVPREIKPPGYLLDPAGDGYGVEDWLYQLLMSWFLRGNAYGKILDRSESGMYRQVDWWHPDTVGVTLDQETGAPNWRVSGVPVPRPQMLHQRAYPIAGTLLGLSPVQAHATTLGLSLTASAFGKQWFTDGGHPSGILSNSEIDMNDTVAKVAKQRFMAALLGSREPVTLGRGWKFDQVQVTPEESQFLETQGFTAAECARILGPGLAEVLGYATGGSMTYANVIDRDVALLKYTASRWMRRADRLLSQFLPRPQYVRLNRDAFLETSSMDRWRKHQIALQTNAMVINEVRAIERLDPVAWGDAPFTAAPATDPNADPAADPNADPTQDPNADPTQTGDAP